MVKVELRTCAKWAPLVIVILFVIGGPSITITNKITITRSHAYVHALTVDTV